MEAQETIIYRLLMRNPSKDAYFDFWFLGPLLAGKWAWPPNPTKTRPKIWSSERTFWTNGCLEFMFSKFAGVNPPPPLNTCMIHIYKLRTCLILQIPFDYIHVKCAFIVTYRVLSKWCCPFVRDHFIPSVIYSYCIFLLQPLPWEVLKFVIIKLNFHWKYL